MTNGVVSAHKENVTDAREMTESDGIVVMENRKFTNTALPVFSGAEGWYQHIHIVQAIVKSNGWPDETAALQLFVHLKGEALDVTLLLTKEERVTSNASPFKCTNNCNAAVSSGQPFDFTMACTM